VASSTDRAGERTLSPRPSSSHDHAAPPGTPPRDDPQPRDRIERSHAAEGGESGGAILAAFLANVGIAVAKFVGFVITGSSALLAESIHSLADSSNQGFLVLGEHRARHRPTQLHQFGYGRARYFWAFVVAVVLFSLGGLFSLYEGYHKVADPRHISSPGVALAILGIAMLFEGAALRTSVRHAQPQRRGRSWPAFIRRSRSPELPVLLLEDSGALVGLSCAALGIVLSLLTGNPVFDGIGTLAIGVLLICIGGVLAVEMSSLLLGESASPETMEQIESELTNAPEVRRVIHLRTQHLGPEDLLVAAKVEFAHELSMAELARAINDCERRVRSTLPIARLIYLEPDLFAHVGDEAR
jgi:cation diffusion facilitator family transporter